MRLAAVFFSFELETDDIVVYGAIESFRGDGTDVT
jgi:hypothetical protein